MKKIVLLPIISILTSCVSMKNLDADYVPKVDDSIIVIGVNPDYQLGFQPGRFNEKGWERNHLYPLALNVKPNNGYIVAKLKPLINKDAYALDQILPRGIGGPRYIPCDNTNTIAFNLDKGKIIYLGDIHMKTTESSVKFSLRNDYNKAKENIENLYPHLAKKIESSEAKIVTTTEECRERKITVVVVH